MFFSLNKKLTNKIFNGKIDAENWAFEISSTHRTKEGERMVIKDDHVKEAIKRITSAEERYATMIGSIFSKTGGDDFAKKIVELLTRAGASHRYSAHCEMAAKLEAAVALRAIYAAIGPLQVALQEKGVDLPEVNLMEFEGTNDLKGSDCDVFFATFQKFNSTWGVWVSAHLEHLKSGVSRIIIGRVVRTYTNALPTALKPEILPGHPVSVAA